MRISIDSTRCEGHGLCYGLVPQLIEPDDDGHGTVVSTGVPEELSDDARRAVSNCPERAVLVDESAN